MLWSELTDVSWLCVRLQQRGHVLYCSSKCYLIVLILDATTHIKKKITFACAISIGKIDFLQILNVWAPVYIIKQQQACTPDCHERAQDRLTRLTIAGNNAVNNVHWKNNLWAIKHLVQCSNRFRRTLGQFLTQITLIIIISPSLQAHKNYYFLNHK